MTRKTPTQAFDSSLQELFRRGALSVIRMTCPSKEVAIRYRARLNKLRTAMRNENHPDWKLLHATCVRIDRADPRILILEPQDYEFAQAIHKVLGTEPTIVPECPITYSDELLDEEAQKKLTARFLKSIR